MIITPSPQCAKYSTWGQEIRQLREQWTWMRADSQWGSAEGARKAWTSSSPQGADWSTSLSPLHVQSNHLITTLIQIKPMHRPPFAQVLTMHNHSTLWGRYSDRPVYDWELYQAFKSFDYCISSPVAAKNRQFWKWFSFLTKNKYGHNENIIN